MIISPLTLITLARSKSTSYIAARFRPPVEEVMVQEIETIADAIIRNAREYPHLEFIFQTMDGVEQRTNFCELEQETGRIAAALQSYGLQKGDRAALVLVEPREFVTTFLACVRIGVLAVPMYPPLSFGNLDAYVERSQRVIDSSGSKVLISSDSLRHLLWGLVGRCPRLERVVGAKDLSGATETPVYPTIRPSDLVFLQYTSGSTADPKGVEVRHENLLANCRAIGIGLDLTAGVDIPLSWLPLYYDMGLIGFVLTPVVIPMTTVFIPTLRFIKRPSVWLEALSRHRGTVTFGPNFAYALAARRVKETELKQWSLSHVKAFGCGAEPIHPTTIRQFVSRLAASGVREDQFLPAYGMAEATLAISFKPLGTRPVIDRLDGDHFRSTGSVRLSDFGTTLDIVSCGPVFEGHEIRAVDEQGQVLPEGREGELQLRGPSVCRGYWGNPEQTHATFSEGWLKTGDLGYIRQGQIYVTGRLKDLIILNGRNIHPQSVEWAAAVDGVRKGNVVAFSRPGSESEELVVALETSTPDHPGLVDAVKQAVQAEIGVSVADVVCLAVGVLPKTSSGKLQRRKTRELYLAGELGRTGSRSFSATADRLTLARHVARSMWSRAKAIIQLR